LNNKYIISWKEHGGAAIVNAFYDSQENSIKFPAGILDGVYFQVFYLNLQTTLKNGDLSL